MMKLREKRVEINDGCQGKMIFSILQSIFAGIIMHLPGLVVKWPFEDWAQYFQSLIGATLEGIILLLFTTKGYSYGYCTYKIICKNYLPLIERPLPQLPTPFYVAVSALFAFTPESSLMAVKGVCLLLIATRVFHYGHHIYKSYVLQNNGNHHHQSLPLLLKLSYITVSALLAISYISFIITCIVGDATFRIMSGNDTPDGETLRHGSANARQHMLSQFQADFQGSLLRLAFGCLCLGTSIYVYMWPLRRKEGLGVDDGGAHENIVSSSTRRRFTIWSGLVAYTLIYEGWYLPVFHAFFSIVIEANDGMAKNNEDMAKKFEPVLRSLPKGKGPNVIYIQHESLSGSLMLNTDEGVKAMVKDMFMMFDNIPCGQFLLTSHLLFILLYAIYTLYSHT